MKRPAIETQSPVVRCRVCKRELVRKNGMWAHAIPQKHHEHLPDPAPADLRKLRDWARRWAE